MFLRVKHGFLTAGANVGAGVTSVFGLREIWSENGILHVMAFFYLYEKSVAQRSTDCRRPICHQRSFTMPNAAAKLGVT